MSFILFLNSEVYGRSVKLHDCSVLINHVAKIKDTKINSDFGVVAPPCSHLPRLQACLQSSDVNYRIAVGETIALLVELGRDIDEVNSHTV